MTSVLSRRRLAQAGLAAGGALVLAACTEDGLSLPGPDPSPDPDRAVLSAALQDIWATLGVVRAAASTPTRRRVLRPTIATHEAHAALLSEALPDLVEPGPFERRIPRQDAAAYAVVARAEERLARQLRSACLDAQSGSFARVLASMAAAAQQQATRVVAS